MAPMNPEFPRKLVELMRDYQRLQADNRALASILEYVRSEGHLPAEGWLAALKELRQKSAYRTISEQYELLFRAVEDAADVEECERLLQTMSREHLRH